MQKGDLEDKLYSKNEFYLNNIRRGNTILFNKDENSYKWIRKGLKKFFDLQ